MFTPFLACKVDIRNAITYIFPTLFMSTPHSSWSSSPSPSYPHHPIIIKLQIYALGRYQPQNITIIIIGGEVLLERERVASPGFLSLGYAFSSTGNCSSSLDSTILFLSGYVIFSMFMFMFMFIVCLFRLLVWCD